MRHKGITRPTVLYWGGRRRADLYMHAWCEQAAAEVPSLRYVPVVSDAAARRRLDRPHGLRPPAR